VQITVSSIFGKASIACDYGSKFSRPKQAILSCVFINGAASMRGMNAVMLSKMKAISQENRRLKRMYAESQMQNELLKAMLGKKG